ncbi:hypothetical protein BDY17DRAFT_320383 [Neohortaea acidophila]|uniref:PWWP domain-containing protein n=1 Tax=Neohortaea acidophila TaxID=245834 RepID=A0A6A6Q658_9PEZI|nr:uncharacterized protein BDY17DRAFT_320383 [Neohortaea acidophila]KAF2487870.1 hypothetical protein BDY17DRAFT_320383 [Neohortaea acidophila]
MQMIAKVPGSTWIYPYQSKSWPVLLCDEETPPEAFMRSRPNSYVFPAILLGKVIYIWVADVHLRPFDFTADYLKDAEPSQDALEAARRKAFTADAGHRHSPAFWKNFIIQRSLARKVEREIDRKRAAPTSDDDEEITFVRTQKKGPHPSTPKKVKLYHSGKGRRDSHRPTPDITSAKSALSAELVDSSDDDDLFVREAKPRADLYISDCNGTDQEERESRV